MTLSRRDLLRMGLLGAGGLAIGGLAIGGLLDACGGTKPTGAPASTASLQGLLDARTAAGATPGMDVVPVGTDLVVGSDNDVVFFLQTGTSRLFGSNTNVWLTPTIDKAAKITPLGPFPAPWLPYSKPDGSPPLPQGINAFNFTFTQPGLWTLIVETTSGPHRLGSSVVSNDSKGIKARGQNVTKVPGDKAVPSNTPTVADPQGVNPICTRQPACDMHQVSLKDALASGKPTAFFIGTPKFCQSRNCGPALEELLVVEAAQRGKVNFVHAEVYPNEDAQTIEQQVTTRTFNEWGLASEPWLFLIDRAGVVRARYEGGFTAAQVQTGLAPLVA